ncbi:MAG TPA: hypothetical protein VJB57_09680 [Dehalococcoidia bacterium]|nr:hypothetical protein [Dehalococcoidia bacterium]
MEIGGGTDREVDRVIWINDLSVATLIALIERLRQTEPGEQMLFREAELDEAYRQADADVWLAARANADRESMAQLHRVRDLIFSAHDYVGDEDIEAAIAELGRIVDISIGLDSPMQEPQGERNAR